MFGNDEDDDFIVSSGSSTKLASLFNMDQSDGGGNQSLKYSAPKQPKKSQQNEVPNAQTSAEAKANSAATAVIHAVAAHSYKYENNKHVHKGKLGVALLGNHEARTYKLLLYKGQQQHVAMATINVHFSFIIQSNNYATFYDDQKDNWSLNFEIDQTLIEFAKQVCIAKANSCSNSFETVISQDLIVGEGDILDEQDSVELKYTGWLLTEHKIGEMFDSNVTAEKCLRVKIGHGKCIKGLEVALIGMRKHGKRLAVIPPSLGYENKQTDVPMLKNSILVYELDVKKVKISNKESSTSTRSSTPSIVESDKDVSGRGRPPSISGDESIRARGASLSEQLSQSPDRKKATIISRIVKMGQPMLPMQGAVVANSESDNDDEISATVASPPIITDSIADHSKPVPRPRPQHVSGAPLISQPGVTSDLGMQQQKQQFQQQQLQQQQSLSQPISIYHPPMPYNMSNQIPCQMPGSQFSVYPQTSYQAPIIPSPMMVGGGDSQVPMLLSENRSQVMEIRLQMNKMSDKLDQVLAKVDHTQMNSMQSGHSMDTATIAFNIQRILTENEKLKMEVQEKNLKIESQNEKICDLLHKNQRFIEQSSSFLEQRSNSSLQMNSVQSQLFTLEQEKLKLSSELNITLSKFDSLQSDLLLAQKKAAECQPASEIAKEELRQTRMTCDSLQNHVAALQQSAENLQQNFEKENKLRILREEELEKMKLGDESAKIENTGSTQELSRLESQMESMKAEYEERIKEMKEQLRKSQTVVPSADSGVMSTTLLVTEVKKIMNSVFRQLQGQFERNVQYSGNEVCRLIKETVLFVTLKLMDKYSTNEGVGTSPEKSETSHDSVNSSVNCNDERTDNAKPTSQNISTEKVSTNSSDNNETSDKISESTSNQQMNESWKPELPPPPSFKTDVLATENDDDDHENNDCDWLE